MTAVNDGRKPGNTATLAALRRVIERNGFTSQSPAACSRQFLTWGGIVSADLVGAPVSGARVLRGDRVSLSVGFYYIVNACGRLLGTLLSGVLYQRPGVTGSLWVQSPWRAPLA